MSTITFGPRLIGETEKTLNALLRHVLAGTDLREPQWVTLQLAGALDGDVDAAGLAAAVADRAHFTDAEGLVASLTQRGLLEDGQPTAAARDLVSEVRDRIATATGPIWDDLPEDDVAAAGRVLNEVAARARAVLADIEG